METKLTYYITQGILAGVVNGRTVHILARSGGGGGTTKSVLQDSANNPYMTGLKRQGTGAQHIHGGPIPVGRYTIGPPTVSAHLGRCAALKPERALPANRGGFYIHGRGPHGSDGCIVPLSGGDFAVLMTGLAASKGGTLHVLETMDDARYA